MSAQGLALPVPGMVLGRGCPWYVQPVGGRVSHICARPSSSSCWCCESVILSASWGLQGPWSPRPTAVLFFLRGFVREGRARGEVTLRSPAFSHSMRATDAPPQSSPARSPVCTRCCSLHHLTGSRIRSFASGLGYSVRGGQSKTCRDKDTSPYGSALCLNGNATPGRDRTSCTSLNHRWSV